MSRRDVLRKMPLTPFQIKRANKLVAQSGENPNVIATLQNMTPRLQDEWRAKRVFRTESKKIQTAQTLADGMAAGEKNWTVHVNPNGCDICKTRAKQKGAQPPFHPNCSCTLVGSKQITNQPR